MITNIEALKEEYHNEGNPVMSMDVKKKVTTHPTPANKP